MAPKKKKLVRKKKTTISLPPFNYSPPNVYELGVKPVLFAKCKICCTSLPHLNFEWPAVPTDLTIAAVKDAIVKRHGGAIPQLTLYKGVAHPENSLANTNDATTLKDMGVEGAYMSGPDAPLPTVTFSYDFEAACFGDAIATVEPETLQSRLGVPLKLYRKAIAPQPPQNVRHAHTTHAPGPTQGGALGSVGAGAGHAGSATAGQLVR